MIILKFPVQKAHSLARKPAEQTVNRDAILLAAAGVLQRHGYAATTMKDIAAQLSLTAGTLYHYFANKDTLVLAVLEMGLEAGIARIEPLACADTAPPVKLRSMIAAHITGLTEQPAIGAAMVFELKALAQVAPPAADARPKDHHDFAAFSEHRRHFFKRRDDFENLFLKVVKAGITQGDFRAIDASIYVKTLLGAQNWVGVWYRAEGRLNGATIAERMADHLMYGVMSLS